MKTHVRLSYSQEVLLELLALFRENDDVDVLSVERTILKDPAVAAKILSVANSPAFSVGQVGSIQHAILTLGFDAIKIIGVWILFYELPSPLPKYIQKRLREHAKKVAIATSLIGELGGDKNYNRGVYYMAGLLHDIGRLQVKDNIIDGLFLQKGNNLLELEEKIHEKDHATQGGDILREFKIPEDICLSAAYHHNLQDKLQDKKLIDGNDDLISAVFLAEHIVSVNSKSPFDDGVWSDYCDTLMSKKLSKDVIVEIEKTLRRGQ